MAIGDYRSALIVGAGSGLSASLARLLTERGLDVTLAARDTGKLDGLCAETGAKAISCDASSSEDVGALFEKLDAAGNAPDVAIYNPSARARGAFVDLDPDEVENAIAVSAFGGFLVAQQAVRRMLARGAGAVLFTGASASVKGYARSAPFAMGKFALRGMAQSMARELHPQNIHVAHFVIDGGIRNPERPGRGGSYDNPDSLLEPDAIARTYLDVLGQHRSAWTWEVELRPWVENF